MVKKNSKWSKEFKPQIKALAEKLEVEEYKVLSALYVEVEDSFGLNLSEYRADYCFDNNLDRCSLHTVIENSYELWCCFEAVLSKMLDRFGICDEVF